VDLVSGQIVESIKIYKTAKFGTVIPHAVGLIEEQSIGDGDGGWNDSIRETLRCSVSLMSRS
jgi:hypothetical protein